MRTTLALAIAVSSAVIGAIFGRSLRPQGPISIMWTMIVAAVGALLAEAASVIWVGPPPQGWQPLVGGILIGVMAGIFSGKKRQPPDKPES
ncbi:hypothetical protein [Sulfobacillus thermosulfidooxidans]|uniref:Uncharacterized protein n=2 Tax=Sulfobacillus thermosulfidooxidans TaxID=28034 RepID=A0A1W1W8P5_SULTA|nr:hypothetical protein [Sulfobacillus thermosulfidooxidans]OLZ08794.1 hypothetical protein BFX05_15080 [Sulfobacillus thermosulfidooxidans]OLZ14304.1 hypothetical protein BFX06_08460 [Sulfobacillus thermosulfidooxidans]OLZ19047.1 hypothetical protein BFX07_04855 [Sulfobacillus thermosulfidooxidans]PSR28577.1 MAG: hypothetical protein C7B47_05310 [Sulfobacillus thermosulfidooxidans]SMC02572.1 hypothetical protein SAMN00768000_0658 [Sulfobacillus thermosulfidooxidans DSM 9293]